MDIQVEKSNFINWLNEQADANLIQELKDLKERYLSKPESEDRKALEEILDMGLKDYEEGRTIDHSVVMEEMDNKYGKLQEVTLTINNNRYESFIKFIKSLDFVDIMDNDDVEVSEWAKELVRSRMANQKDMIPEETVMKRLKSLK